MLLYYINEQGGKFFWKQSVIQLNWLCCEWQMYRLDWNLSYNTRSAAYLVLLRGLCGSDCWLEICSMCCVMFIWECSSVQPTHTYIDLKAWFFVSILNPLQLKRRSLAFMSGYKHMLLEASLDSVITTHFLFQMEEEKSGHSVNILEVF